MTIIKDDDAFSSDTKSPLSSTHADLPPPYVPRASSSTTTPTQTPSSFPAPVPRPFQARGLPPNAPPPSNFLTIKREHASIRETCVVDAGLARPVPAAAREQGLSGWVNSLTGKKEGRPKNLVVASTHGSVDVDVWLVGEYDGRNQTGLGERSEQQQPAAASNGRAELDVSSVHGSVVVKLNTLTTRPYSLRANAKHASVCVALPRSFAGPVTLRTTHGSVRVSDALSARMTTFAEAGGARECFIGDVEGYQGKESWTGSMVDLGSYHSTVKLVYIDEVDQITGFWSKLFGGLF